MTTRRTFLCSNAASWIATMVLAGCDCEPKASKRIDRAARELGVALPQSLPLRAGEKVR